MPPTAKPARESPVAQAVRLGGGPKAMAAKLGVSRQRIQQMLASGIVPPHHVIPMEKAVNGVVTRYELDPVLYPRDHVAAAPENPPL